jgi:exopolyphosphatase / guanosine-5'-triphosphate,3'-diphosphate pyrophosphatase
VRVAIVDIGTNSTRLLIADVAQDGRLTQLVKESIVTRLGEGVDAIGRLAAEPMRRVCDTLERYRTQIDEHGVAATTAVLTSAVRDAANGAEFVAEVRERFGLDARTIDGDEEAALTFAGATSERPDDHREIVVVDVGGGSTEFVTGHDGNVDFHVSTQAGVVRQTERHLHDDPPPPEELQALAAETQTIFGEALPADLRERVQAAIAVAGTATSCAAIELELDPYDPRGRAPIGRGLGVHAPPTPTRRAQAAGCGRGRTPCCRPWTTGGPPQGCPDSRPRGHDSSAPDRERSYGADLH